MTADELDEAMVGAGGVIAEAVGKLYPGRSFRLMIGLSVSATTDEATGAANGDGIARVVSNCEDRAETAALLKLFEHTTVDGEQRSLEEPANENG